MPHTEEYRAQHRELIRLAGGLTGSLDPDGLLGDPRAVHAALGVLAERLGIHLEAEDAHLYPELLRHPEAEVRDLARAFQEEMGRIQGDFEALLARWRLVESVREDPCGFTVELLSALDVLRRRIHLEDLELYPRVDRLESGRPAESRDVATGFAPGREDGA